MARSVTTTSTHAGAGQRVRGLAHQLGAVLAVAVLHHDDQRLLAGDQVHRAADAAQARIAQAEVGQVALLVDLVGAQDDGVQSLPPRAISNDVDAVEERGAWQRRRRTGPRR